MAPSRERHSMPDFVRDALDGAGLVEAYEARPPYQRNDYLGWIGKVKRDATKQRRLAQMLDELRAGDLYMNMPWGRRGPVADATKPRLLSGGNPQIAMADGDAPVQAYIAAMPGWKQAVGARVDALVCEAVPDVRKAVRWNSPFYGIDGQGWFLSVHCFTRYVKLTFLNGASHEPRPPVDLKAPRARCLHISEGESLDEEQLAAWGRQAAAIPGEELF